MLSNAESVTARAVSNETAGVHGRMLPQSTALLIFTAAERTAVAAEAER
jgi:hypothetical protein